jgi:hypothetical protein
MENALAVLLSVVIAAVANRLKDPHWWEERYRRKREKETDALLARIQSLGRK